MKTDFFLEWPWMSMKAEIGSGSLASLIRPATIDFIAHTVGCSFGLGYMNYRLRSVPQREVLQFPTMTPSGLLIGIILNTILFLSSAASGFVGLVMNLINPCMI